MTTKHMQKCLIQETETKAGCCKPRTCLEFLEAVSGPSSVALAALRLVPRPGNHCKTACKNHKNHRTHPKTLIHCNETTFNINSYMSFIEYQLECVNFGANLCNFKHNIIFNISTTLSYEEIIYHHPDGLGGDSMLRRRCILSDQMVFRHWFLVKTANQQYDSHQARKSVRHA